MKVILVVLLVFASVALFKAEEVPEDVEELANDEDSSASFLYDGSMEDEVMGDVDDPVGKAKKAAALTKKGEKRVCGGVFIGCLKKTKARCKLIPVCKVKYFACRCIIKGVRKCKKFLRFVRVLAKKHKGRKQDEELEDEEEDPKKKKGGKLRARVRVCKKGYRKCSKGKKFCGKCLEDLKDCIKGKKPKPAKKGDESEEEEEVAMADAVENDEEEETKMEDDEEDPKKPRPNKKIKLCAKIGVKCMLRARLNCRKQGRCVRILMKCVRRVRRPSKQ